MGRQSFEVTSQTVQFRRMSLTKDQPGAEDIVLDTSLNIDPRTAPVVRTFEPKAENNHSTEPQHEAGFNEKDVLDEEHEINEAERLIKEEDYSNTEDIGESGELTGTSQRLIIPPYIIIRESHDAPLGLQRYLRVPELTRRKLSG